MLNSNILKYFRLNRLYEDKNLNMKFIFIFFQLSINDKI